jgi:hypothetical protein
MTAVQRGSSCPQLAMAGVCHEGGLEGWPFGRAGATAATAAAVVDSAATVLHTPAAVVMERLLHAAAT